MSRHGKPPGYLLHKPTGQDRVLFNGRHVYLGRYGSDESHQRYQNILAEWRAARQIPTAEPSSQVADELTVEEIIAGYWDYLGDRFGDTGKQRGSRNNYRPMRNSDYAPSMTNGTREWPTALSCSRLSSPWLVVSFRQACLIGLAQVASLAVFHSASRRTTHAWTQAS